MHKLSVLIDQKIKLGKHDKKKDNTQLSTNIVQQERCRKKGKQ